MRESEPVPACIDVSYDTTLSIPVHVSELKVVVLYIQINSEISFVMQFEHVIVSKQSIHCLGLTLKFQRLPPYVCFNEVEIRIFKNIHKLPL